MEFSRIAGALAGGALLAGCAGPAVPRVEQALPRFEQALARFEQALAANDSATAALQDWCAARHIADPARITATPAPGDVSAASPDLRAELGVGESEPLGYRHVRLSCGGKVLSEAHNWYVPARLTPAMNAALTATDTPFGKVAAPLGFQRERLASRRERAAECPAGTVLSHRALLRLPDGRALALVVECYSAANITRTG